jgi:riboflavin-specific deaminase-like protein
VVFERLHPDPGPIDAADVPAALAFGARAGAERPFVAVNMVATIDGRATVGGLSGPIGGDGDLAMFHALRGSVDAVLAGTKTMGEETYGRLVRSPERRAARAALGLDEDPVAMVLTRSGNVPWQAPLFAAPEQRVLIFSAPGAVTVPDGTAAEVEVVGCGDLTPSVVLAVARERGIRSVLCEGGPSLNRSLLAEGLVDELFLTVGPLIAGDEDAPSIVGGAALDPPARMGLRWVLRHGDELFLRYGK